MGGAGNPNPKIEYMYRWDNKPPQVATVPTIYQSHDNSIITQKINRQYETFSLSPAVPICPPGACMRKSGITCVCNTWLDHSFQSASPTSL